jgi:protein-S-isoprenylcysteine O-methyltransferase Ste14
MGTGYIPVGTAIEERTLVSLHADAYRDYRQRVRGFLPLRKRAA